MADDQYRGLLTEREREILTGEAKVSDGYYRRVRARVRRKIENIGTDYTVLVESEPDLAEELKTEICE